MTERLGYTLIEPRRRPVTWPVLIWVSISIFILVAAPLSPLARAASIASSSGHGAEAHARYCSCGSGCRQSACCCGSKTARPQPNSALPLSLLGPTDLDASPCLNSDTCHDSGLPVPPESTEPVGKPAAVAGDHRSRFANAGLSVSRRSRCALPPGRASRLDRPPERLFPA